MRKQAELLQLAAEQLEDGRYLDGDFIERHNLHIDETMAVWKSLELLIKAWLSLNPQQRQEFTFRGAAYGILPGYAIEAGLRQARLPGAVKELQAALARGRKKGGK